MKILKYLLILVLLLVLIFFGNGLLTPSVSYENTIMVNKPIEESWAVMSDEATMSKWITGFVKTELVMGTKNTVGAVSNIYVEEDGEEMVMEETITAIKENELMAMSFTMDFMDMDYELYMEPKNGQTYIKTNSITVGNGIFAKSIIAFIADDLKVQEDENLMKLKGLIEANTKDYSPEPELEIIED